MASHLIGVLGLKRSGKDTFASRLVDAHGFTRLAFADVMREALLALDPYVTHVEMWEEESLGASLYVGTRLERLSDYVGLHGWERAKGHPEVRRLLQRFGTEAGRNIHGEDVWVNLTAAQVAAVPGPVVITDVRFPNEVDYVRRNGGKTARITRAGIVPDPNGHASETSVNDIPVNFSVANNSSVEALHAIADAIASTVLSKSR